MKRTLIAISLFLFVTLGFAQSDRELVKTAIEFEDVQDFLREHLDGEIYLKQESEYVSIKNGERAAAIDPEHSVLILNSVIEDKNYFTLKFDIDEQIVGKVKLVATNDELKVRRAWLKAGDGRDKSRMVSFEF